MRTWIHSLLSTNGKRPPDKKRSFAIQALGAEQLAFESLEQRALLSADAAMQAANAAAMTSPASTGTTENITIINNFNSGGTANGGTGTTAASSGTTTGAATNSTSAGVTTGINGSLASSGVNGAANGNVNNGTGTNGQFGLQTGVNTTSNGQVTGTSTNSSFGSQNPGDAGMGAPGTSFNPGVGVDTRPGSQNPGDAGFGAPGTSFNPTGVPASQAGPGGNGTAAAHAQATDAAMAGTDTAVFNPAVLQFEREFAATHPIR